MQANTFCSFPKKLEIVERSKKSGKMRGKTSIPLDVLINAISHLSDKISQLDNDKKWRSINSFWSRVAADLSTRLPIKNDLRLRKYIYTTWNRQSSNLRSHFIKQPKELSSESKKDNLEQLSSIPSLTKVRTRSKAVSSSNANINSDGRQLHLIEFSYEEWRNVRFVYYDANESKFIVSFFNNLF